MALAGEHQVGAVESVGQADETATRSKPGLDPRAQRDQAAGEAAGGAGAGHGGDVDARLDPVAAPPRRAGGAARPPARSVAPFCGPKTTAASTKGVVTSDATTSSTPAQRVRRADGVEGAHATVGRGGAAAADDDAARPRRRGRPAGAGRHRSCRRAPGPRRAGCGTRARPAALDISMTAVGGAPHRQRRGAPLGVDGRAERPGDPWHGAVAAERVEQALAAVGHGHLVGGPAGPAGRAGGRGGDLGGGRRPPEFVRCDDEVGHRGDATAAAAPRPGRNGGGPASDPGRSGAVRVGPGRSG